MIFIPSQLKNITVATVVDIAGAYASGDALTSVTHQLAGVFKGFQAPSKLVKVVVTDAAKQNAALKLMFWNRPIAAPTFNLAFTPLDAVLQYYVGHVTIAATDYISLFDNSVGSILVDQMPFSGNNATSLWMTVVTTSTPTFVAANDVSFRLTFDQQ